MSLRLRPLEDEELPSFLETVEREYAEGMAAFASMSEDAAQAKAARDHRTLFPAGRPLEGHTLNAVEDEEGHRLGRLWFAEREGGLWLYDIAIDEAERGRGHGREAMLLLEAEARRRGVSRIELNVWGGNERARGLYRSLGWTETSVHMEKRL